MRAVSHSVSNSHCNGYRHGYCDSHSHCHCHGYDYGYVHAQTDAHPAAGTDCKASPHPGAKAVSIRTWSLTVKR